MRHDPHGGSHHRHRCMRGPKHGGRHGFGGIEGREGRHGHFRGGRGGGGRFFDHGELRHVVLALLGEQPRHGYDIIRAIEQRTGGAYAPSPGVIYPTLQLLQDVGHAAPTTGDDGRNSYQITPAGRAFLDENSALVGDILSRMMRAGRAQASPAIVAAIDNLKSALRSNPDPWSETDAREVAAAIEAAAGRIRALHNAPPQVSDAKRQERNQQDE